MTIPAPAAPSPARVWWMASRPATLTASVAPVLAGTAVAVVSGGPRLLQGLLALVVALGMQVGVNYANDYSDFARGADRSRVGPLRAASSGVVPPGRVRAAAIAAFAVAALAGLVLAALVGWWLLAVGALSIAAGWLYTGGPRPYGYAGLGEVFVFVFMGLVATIGTTYVEVGRLEPLAGLGGIVLGLVACAILSVNNLRDLGTDAAAGKRTLAVRLGRDRTRGLIAALLALALLLPLVAWPLGWAGPAILLCLLPAPLATGIVRATLSTQPAVLVGALRRTAELEAWLGLAFAIGVLAR